MSSSRYSLDRAREMLIDALQQCKPIAPDALDVSPQKKCDESYMFTQPIMAPSGHIVEAKSQSSFNVNEVISYGDNIINKLRAGQKLAGTVEMGVAVALAWAVSRKSADGVVDKAADGVIQEVVANFWWSYVDVEADPRVMRNPLSQMYVDSCSLGSFFDEEDRAELFCKWKDGKIPLPGKWKDVRNQWDKHYGSEKHERDMTNAAARTLYKKLIGKGKKSFNYRKSALERALLLDEIQAGFDDGNVVVNFIINCWRCRPSSISCNLPKHPPECIQRLVGSPTCSAKDLIESINERRRKFVELMRRMDRWVDWPGEMPYGSGPIKWSDILSKAAKSINPDIQRLNSMGLEHTPYIPELCSFVPADLAPAMYRKGTCCCVYFFGMGHHILCYTYSPRWRITAFRLLGTSSDNVIPEKFDALKKLSACKVADSDDCGAMLRMASALEISDVLVCDYLRWYYFSAVWIRAPLEIFQA